MCLVVWLLDARPVVRMPGVVDARLLGRGCRVDARQLGVALLKVVVVEIAGEVVVAMADARHTAVMGRGLRMAVTAHEPHTEATDRGPRMVVV